MRSIIVLNGRVKPGSKFGVVAASGFSFRTRWNGFLMYCCVVACSKCGNVSVAKVSALRKTTKGCRCIATPKKTHGKSKTQLYNIFKTMHSRCNNKNHSVYYNYGQRGIRVCQEWSSYEVFEAWAIANGWEPGLDFDRFPDKNGDYSPENCRLVTRKQNNRNARSNRLVTAFGETKCIAEWAEDERCVVGYFTLRNRLIAYGWPPEKSMITPPTNCNRWGAK